MSNDQHNSNDDIDPELLQGLQSLPKMQAPQSLHDKLMQIPKQYAQKHATLPTSAARKFIGLGLAAAASLLLYLNIAPQQAEYSAAEIALAQQELEIAFNYVGKYSTTTTTEVNQLLSNTSTRAIYKGMLYPIVEKNHSGKN